MMARDRPDVALIDPDSDDITLQAITALTDAGVGRVLVLTGHTDAQDHQRAFELGAAGVVLKSQPTETLVRAIHKVHAGELWLERTKTASVLNGMMRQPDPEDA